MKKLFPDSPDVSQSVANRGVRIIEKHLRMHKVDRAKDLSEEARVRLLRDLQAFFDSEMRVYGTPRGPSSEPRGFWSRLWERIENFLSFSEGDAGVPNVLCTLGNGPSCVMLPRRR